MKPFGNLGYLGAGGAWPRTRQWHPRQGLAMRQHLPPPIKGLMSPRIATDGGKDDGKMEAALAGCCFVCWMGFCGDWKVIAPMVLSLRPERINKR